jgi:hypothetical protein
MIENKNPLEKLKKLTETIQYKKGDAKAALERNPSLRKIFINVAINNPTKLGDILSKLPVCKNTSYKLLHELKNYGLLNKIPIMDLWNRNDLNDTEKDILNKFNDWSSKMNPSQVRRYAATTCYWSLTELGMDEEVIEWVVKLEGGSGIKAKVVTSNKRSPEDKYKLARDNLKFFCPNLSENDIELFSKEFSTSNEEYLQEFAINKKLFNKK